MKSTFIQIRVTTEQKAALHQAASNRGLTLTQLILEQCLPNVVTDSPITPNVTTKFSPSPPPVTTPPGRPLCHRRARIGSPSCEQCRAPA